MPLPIEIMSTLVGIAGAAIGYGYREFRNRVRPFFQITEIDGQLIKRTDRATVSQTVSANVSGAFCIDKLKGDTDLGDLSDSLNDIRNILKIWPEQEPKIDDILSSTDDETLCNAIAAALESRSVDNWLGQLLVSDRIVVKPVPKVERIPVHDDDDNKGQVWFLFPRKGVTFGHHFNNGAIRAKCQPFINAVHSLDVSALKDSFAQFKSHLQSEIHIASLIRSEVESTVNENSRWAFHCYLANLSEHPIVIENSATLRVQDRSRLSHKMPCYLVKIGITESGRRSLQDTTSPLVVKGGEDVHFAFITNDTQSKMDLGNALRECFDRGEATCDLTVTIRRVGLIKRQNYRSMKSRFTIEKKNGADR